MSNPLFQKLYQWEDIAPDKIYLTQPYDGGQCITYTWKEALEQVRRMAAYLHSLGLPEGSRIAMFSKNCSHFILADLAIWMAGHVSVALYPTVGEETAHYALTHSEAALVFVGKLDEGPWQEIQKGIPADLPKISFPPHISPPNDFLQWDDLVAQHEPMPGHPMPDKHKLASIAYTSGSTGQPKGVMHSFHSMLASSGRMDAYFSISPDDRMLSYLPLAHVFERLTVEVASIWYGFALFFAEAVDTFQADLARARPTFFVSVPRLWLLFQQGVFKKMPPQRLNWMLKVPILSRIIKKKILQGLGLDQVRIAVSGSAPIPPELLKWYNDIGLELLEGYGMSENFAYSHLSRPGMVKVGTVGPPCEGVQQRISEEGEILVKSPCDMLGYYKMEALTKQSYTEDGFLKTGDRGEIDQLGRLRITGRRLQAKGRDPLQKAQRRHPKAHHLPFGPLLLGARMDPCILV